MLICEMEIIIAEAKYCGGRLDWALIVRMNGTKELYKSWWRREGIFVLQRSLAG
jgi:hypothetical protein